MLIKFKKSLLFTILFFLGYANISHADECGVLHYLANKSNGVTITGNSCKTVEEVALGSEIDLSSGARLWVKSATATGAGAKMQVICQNRSTKSVHINVDSDKQPWIKPTDLTSCSLWTNNKMSCAESEGGQNALNCVMAAIESDSAGPKKLEERTTSVKMRSIPMPGAANKTEPKSPEAQNEHAISAMQPDVKLCREINQSSASIKLNWLVGTNGQVNTIIPAANETDETIAKDEDNKPFIDCLKAVIKDAQFSQSSQAVWLSSQF
jgi:hypothetical protein